MREETKWALIWSAALVLCVAIIVLGCCMIYAPALASERHWLKPPPLHDQFYRVDGRKADLRKYCTVDSGPVWSELQMMQMVGGQKAIALNLR